MKEQQKVILIQRLFNYLNKNWAELRLFAFYNRTIFELFFLIIYTFEQGILIYLTQLNGIDANTVSYFSLIVLFTFGVHKIIMESRMKLLEERMNEFKKEYTIVKQESKEIVNSYKEVIEAYIKMPEKQ